MFCCVVLFKIKMHYILHIRFNNLPDIVKFITGYAGFRDYVGTPQSPQKTPHRSTPTDRPTLSQEFCAGCELFEVTITRTELLREGRSRFFSGMCGYVWGLLWRLRGPYVISRTRRTPSYKQSVFKKKEKTFLGYHSSVVIVGRFLNFM